MIFTALDFETANWYRKSACSIGLIKVENGKIIDEYYSLIKPNPYWFSEVNSNIHGISDKDCHNARTFLELWPTISNWIEDQIIVAHNVSFERSVLHHLFHEYHIDKSTSEYLCSLYLSRVAYPKLKSYKLPYVYYKTFNKPFGTHHNALDDARASAELVIKITNEWNPPNFKGMIGALYEKPTNHRTNINRKIKLSSLTPEIGFEKNNELKGKVYTFSGDLDCFTKEEAGQFIVNHGGKVNDNLTKSTTNLVVGKFPRFGKNHVSRKMLRAIDYNNKGENIEFSTEEQFLKMTEKV